MNATEKAEQAVIESQEEYRMNLVLDVYHSMIKVYGELEVGSSNYGLISSMLQILDHILNTNQELTEKVKQKRMLNKEIMEGKIISQLITGTCGISSHIFKIRE